MENYLELYDQGIHRVKKHDYTEAISIFTSAIAQNADFEKALLQRAICYRQLLRPKSAIEDLNQVIKMNGHNSYAYFEKGLNECQLKDYRSAGYDFDNALKYNPKDVDAALWKAYCMAHLKEYPNAIVAVNQALKVQADNKLAYLQRSTYYCFLDQHDKMIQDVNRVLQIDPENVSAHLIRGLYYCVSGQALVGMNDFETVLKLDEKNEFAQKMVGEISASLISDQTDFKKYLKEIPKLLPPMPHQNPTKPMVKEKKAIKEHAEETKLTSFDQLIGLNQVQNQVDNYLSVWKINQELKRRDMEPTNAPLNMIFDGNPGTGKDTVAKLLSYQLYQMKLLDKKKLVVVSPKDLVSPYPGQSSDQTKDVLNKAINGVLVINNIDELLNYKENNAYLEVLEQLFRYSKDPKKTIMIIFAGQTQKLHQFFERTDFDFRNQFNHWVHFADYSNEEMLELLNQQLTEQKKHFDDQNTEQYLKQKLNHYLLVHNHAQLGNAHFIQKVVNTLSSNQSLRLSKFDLANLPDQAFQTINMVDVQTTLMKLHVLSVTPVDQGIHSATDRLNAMIGLSSVKDQIKKYVANAMVDKKLGKLQSDLTNMNMVFAGSAGTGKTTVARLFSQIMYEHGILKTNHCNEVSAQDLVASYVGQTAPKTHQQVLNSLGGVLFIDEAYALRPSGNNDFNREAVDQLVKDMEDYKENLIVILAGYTDPMREFLDHANPGLRSRFNHWIEFPDYTDDEMLDILNYQLNQQELSFEDDKTRQLISESLIVILHNTNRQKLGNARFIRQVVANLIENKNLRLVSQIDQPGFDQKQLRVITHQDVEATFEDLNHEYLKRH